MIILVLAAVAFGHCARRGKQIANALYDGDYNYDQRALASYLLNQHPHAWSMHGSARQGCNFRRSSLLVGWDEDGYRPQRSEWEDSQGDGGYRSQRRVQRDDSRHNDGYQRQPRSRRQSSSNRFSQRSNDGYSRETRTRSSGQSRFASERYPHSDEDFAESNGHDSIYGVSPVIIALRAKRREFVKLYMQDTLHHGVSDRAEINEIRSLADELGIDIETRDKGFLNSLCNNRPHQGVVLKASHLEFEPLKALPNISNGDSGKSAPVWLALDMVTDPQNFGSLLRSAFFLGVDGVLVSKKNSCPLTPVVSKASAGAAEVMLVHSTPNLVKTLEIAREDGWQVLGAALDPKRSISVSEVDHSVPTVLVLGSEGEGLRTNILNACSHLVSVARGTSAFTNDANANLVDSLNVGVAGGVLLHSLLSPRSAESH